MLYLFTPLLFVIFISTSAFSQNVANWMSQRELMGTLQIKYKNGTASAFQYKGVDSSSYLITAKHVFQTKYKRVLANSKAIRYNFYDSLPYKNGDKVDVKIFYGGQWHNIDAYIYYDNAGSDVAVLKTDIPMVGNSYIFGADQSYESQDCFFIGYPLGLRQDMSRVSGFSPYPIPFVRKGIISALGENKGGVISLFYIDAHVTYGFSGGPLIYYNYAKKAYYVAGVVSGYIPQQNVIYKSDGTIQTSEENSGLMEVYNIEYAVRILKSLHAY